MSGFRYLMAPDPVEKKFPEFCAVLRIGQDLGKILWNRGIKDFESAKTFFNPDITGLHSPWEMPDMEKAVNRVLQAMQKGEKIRFYGDYDVDGTTSVAMMLNHFREVYNYPHIDFYIPDRYREGYGISELGVRKAVEDGIGLMITLDCGIKAINTLRLADSLGLDVIVCDHHLPGDELPPALAVLNPKRRDSEYPWKELSGCGVGFKLITGLNEKMNLGEAGYSTALQLAAVSSCCDIVDLRGENRIITSLGLKELNTNPLPGLAGIRSTSGLERDFQVEDVVFVIGPRINAAGRIGHGEGAVRLLTLKSEDPELLQALQQIDEQNRTRKDLDREITAEALKQIQNPEDFTTVVYNPSWHKGVVGIVASRLIETVYRPTVVLTASEGKVTGSARSIPGFDLHEAISSCSHLLLNYGGHTFAAGLTMPEEKLAEFKEAFEAYARKQLSRDALIPSIHIDAEIPVERIQDRFCEVLRRMAPFGPGHMNPVFMSRNVQVVPHSVKIYNEGTLKFEVKTRETPARYFEVVGFKFADKYNLVKESPQVGLVYTIQEKLWNGKKSLQISLKDLFV